MSDILDQPPTPENLVRVLGWKDHGSGYIRSDKSRGGVRLESSPSNDDCDRQLWVQAGVCHRDIPTPPTLRDVVTLCGYLGIPCEVRV